MQEKQGRMMTWMAGLLVVLVGVVVLGEDTEEPEDDEETWTDAFPDVERSAVDALTIASGTEALALQREDNGWALRAPITAPADEDRVRSLLGTLEDLECGEDLQAEDAAAFGLAPPAFSLTLSAGDAEHTLSVGTAAPVGGRTYVMCGDDAVRTTRARLSDLLSTDPADFRSRAVARFPISALTGMTITLPVLPEEPTSVDDAAPLLSAGTATLTAERTAAGWRDAATGTLLDEEKLLAMAEALADAQVEAFDVEPPTPPLIEITATADGTEHTLKYGINGTARVPLQDAPVTLSGDFPVPGTLDTLHAAVLMPIDPVSLTGLTVRLGEQTVSATREANGWSQPAAEGVLAALLEVRVDRSLPAPAAEGAASGEVVLSDADGQQHTLTFHQDIDGQRVASDPAGGPTFFLPATEVARLSEALVGTP